jgi:hypothetical protein
MLQEAGSSINFNQFFIQRGRRQSRACFSPSKVREIAIELYDLLIQVRSPPPQHELNPKNIPWRCERVTCQPSTISSMGIKILRPLPSRPWFLEQQPAESFLCLL